MKTTYNQNIISVIGEKSDLICIRCKNAKKMKFSAYCLKCKVELEPNFLIKKMSGIQITKGGEKSMTKSICDICKTTENVSNTWNGSILCKNCEAKVEASKKGEISESSKQTESVYYPEDINCD